MKIKVGDYIRVLNKVRPEHFSTSMDYLLDGKAVATAANMNGTVSG